MESEPRELTAEELDTVTGGKGGGYGERDDVVIEAQFG